MKFFPFLFFIALACAVKISILFPDDTSTVIGESKGAERVITYFSPLSMNEILIEFLARNPSRLMLESDVIQSLKINGLQIYRSARHIFRNSISQSQYCENNHGRKSFFYGFPSTDLITPILLENFSNGFTIGINFLLRPFEHISTIRHLKGFFSGYFDLTIDEYQNQMARISEDKIQFNLNEIRRVLLHYQHSGFHGTEVIDLRRVIIVLRHPITGELTFRIIVPAILGRDINALLVQFDSWSKSIIEEYQTQRPQLMNEEQSQVHQTANNYSQNFPRANNLASQTLLSDDSQKKISEIAKNLKESCQSSNNLNNVYCIQSFSSDDIDGFLNDFDLIVGKLENEPRNLIDDSHFASANAASNISQDEEMRILQISNQLKESCQKYHSVPREENEME